MRKLTVLLIGAFILAALSGCKGGSGEVRTGGKTVLKVLHYQEAGSPEAEVENEIFVRFQKANPDIKLQIERLYGQDFHSRVKSFSSSEKMPELIYMWPGGMSSGLFRKGLVEDLSPYLEEVREQYVDSIFATQATRDRLYVLPTSLTATHVLYVNKGLFRRYNIPLPTNFDELLALPGIIKGKSSASPITMGNKSNWVMNSCLFSTIIGRLGGEDWSHRVVDGTASFRDRVFIDALYAVKNLYDTGALGKKGSLNTEYGDSPYNFAKEEAFIMIDGDWRINTLSELLSEQQQERLELMTLPALDGELSEKGAISIVPAAGFGMKKGLTDEQARAAWRFISYYAGAEASELRLVKLGIVPSYKLDLSKYELSPHMRKRVEYIHKHPSLFVIDNIFNADIILRLNQGLQELGRGEISPERLARELDSLLKEQRK